MTTMDICKITQVEDTFLTAVTYNRRVVCATGIGILNAAFLRFFREDVDGRWPLRFVKLEPLAISFARLFLGALTEAM